MSWVGLSGTRIKPTISEVKDACPDDCAAEDDNRRFTSDDNRDYTNSY
jgi:hypothetical protein